MRPNAPLNSVQRPPVEGTGLSRHDRKIQQRVNDFMDNISDLIPSPTGKLTCLKYLLNPHAKVLSDSKSAEFFNDKFHHFVGELDDALSGSKKASNRQEFLEGLKTAMAKASLGNRYNEFVTASNQLSNDELIAWIGRVQKEIQPPKIKNRSPSQPVLPTQTNPVLTTQTTTQTTTTSTQPVLTAQPAMVMQQPVQMSAPMFQPMMPAYPQGGNFVPAGNYFPAPVPSMQVPMPAFPQQQQAFVPAFAPAYPANGMMYANPAQFPQTMMQAPVAPMNPVPVQPFSMSPPQPQPAMQQPVVPQPYPQPMMQQAAIPQHYSQPYQQPATQQPGIPQPIPPTILQPMAPVAGNPMITQTAVTQPAPIPVKTEAAAQREQPGQVKQNPPTERVNINRQLSNESNIQLESVFNLYTEAQFNRRGTITVIKYLVNAEVPGPASNPDTQRFNDKFFRFTNAFDLIAGNVRRDEYVNWNFQVIRRIALTKFNAAEVAILTTRFAIDEPRNEIAAWLNTLYGIN